MLRFYFTTLTRLLSGPRQFFSQFSQEIGLKKALGYLLISSVLFSVAFGLNARTAHPLIAGGLFFINAVGMTFISATVGYLLIAILKGGARSPFPHVFSIFALSSGTTLIAAWIPSFLIITEPWKWWLIGIGMVKICHLSFGQTLCVIGLSVGLMACAFGVVLPLTLPQPG